MTIQPITARLCRITKSAERRFFIFHVYCCGGCGRLKPNSMKGVMMVSLYEHQKAELEATEGMSHVAYYHDMGLGKTFTGAEKMERLGAKVNLIICQKSKVADWVDHINEHYYLSMVAWDMTDKLEFDSFMLWATHTEDSASKTVGVINYELAWRRKELLQLHDFTLMLDESSLIQNERAKRSKFILSLQPKNVILLSGTPVGGKYERLWSQMKLLGWDISRAMYWRQYVDVSYLSGLGRGIPIVKGYKNVARLKRKMAEHGCRFLTSADVFDMPDQNIIKVKVEPTAHYRIFRRHGYCKVSGIELVGDTTLTKMLYERQLCGIYNSDKMQAFVDLVESTEDRLVVFYNFNDELEAMLDAVDRSVKRNVPISIVNGSAKDLSSYRKHADSITFVQYQAGAMGLNLQLANKVIYFTLPLSSELFEQSKKRIHRIGQERACFYYILLCKNSIEEKILAALQVRKDYTEKLFQRG